MEENTQHLRILNLPVGSSEEVTHTPKQSQNVAKDLRLAMLRLVSEYMDESTGATNYSAMANADGFENFQEISKELAHCDPADLNSDELKAFFITYNDIYNVLTWHAVVVYNKETKLSQQIESVLDIALFWERFGYKIGEYPFSLDDIEHGVLRGNSIHPSSQKRMFGEGDPRSKLSVISVDPRIHFALNCGAKSCPRVRVYWAENLDQTLDEATQSYLRQEVSVEKSAKGNVLILPQIFDWYAADFAPTDRGVLRWIMKYTEGTIKEVIGSLVKDEQAGENSVRYIYDWSLNQKY